MSVKQIEVVVLPIPILSCELWKSVKENANEKNWSHFLKCANEYFILSAPGKSSLLRVIFYFQHAFVADSSYLQTCHSFFSEYNPKTTCLNKNIWRKEFIIYLRVNDLWPCRAQGHKCIYRKTFLVEAFLQ